MVDFDQKDVQAAQGKLDNIRCVCVLGDRRTGKSTVVQLLEHAGGIRPSEEGVALRQTLVSGDTKVASASQLEVRTLLFRGKEEVKENELIRRQSLVDIKKERATTQPVAAASSSSSKAKGTMELEVQSVMRAHRVLRALKSKRSTKLDNNGEGSAKPRPSRSRTRTSALTGGEGSAGFGAIAKASRIFKKSLDGKLLGTRTTTLSRSSALRLQAEAEDDLDADLGQLNPLDKPMMCYLLDTPGHSDLVGEAAAALRLADSAVLVVNMLEGLSQHGEALLRRAAAERLQTGLLLTRVDRCLDGRYTAEQLECLMHAAVDSANSVLMASGDEVRRCEYRGIKPEQGELVFGSATQGWMISLPLLARIFHEKFGLKLAALSRRLWRAARKTVTRTATQDSVNSGDLEAEERLEAGPLLRLLILEPLLQLCAAFRIKDWEKARAMLEGMHLPALGYGEKHLAYDSLVTKIMKRLADGDAAQVMCHLLAFLPSPAKAQGLGRCQHLFTGPAEGEAADALRRCSPEGPLILAVARLLPSTFSSQKYALGRVFCGSVAVGQKLRVHSFKDREIREHGRQELAVVETLALPAGFFAEPLKGPVHAGNLVLLSGPEGLLFKSGTLVDPSLDCGLCEIRATLPLVRVSVRPAQAEDLPRLVSALRQLSSFDPVARCRAEEWGEHVIAGLGEVHLSACIKELASELAAESEAEVQLVYDKPEYATARRGADEWSYGVEYKETVRAASSSSSSSAAGVRCTASAQSLDDRICRELEEGGPLLQSKPRQRALMLADRFGWELRDGQTLWAFGPADGCGTNVFVQGEADLHDPVAGAMAGACRWASAEGAICEEPLRGIRFNLDLLRGEDVAATPGFRQARVCCAAARRALLAAALDTAALPGLQEPWSLAELSVPPMAPESLALLWGLLAAVRGLEFLPECDPDEEGSSAQSQKWCVQLPTLEVIGLEGRLNEALGVETLLIQSSVMGWATLPGTLGPLGPLGDESRGSRYFQDVVDGLRRWRQLNPAVPSQEEVMRTVH